MPDADVVYETVWSGATWREAEPPPPAPEPEREVPGHRVAPVKLQAGGTSEVVLKALALPGTAGEVRRRTGLPPQTVHKALWRLCLVGLVTPCPGFRPKQGTRYQRAG